MNQRLTSRAPGRSVRALAAPYWLREEKWQARGLLAMLVLLLLGQTGVDVLFNRLTGEFTSALAARDAERFWSSIRQCLAILVVAVPIYAFYYYVRDKLGLHWRRWLTRHLLSAYFSNRAYYRLNASAEIDNPDQRVNLPDLAARFGGLDADLDWAKVLAVGEQQRVAFGRVLLSVSRCAILNEATSALDIANEDSLYRQLAASGTTLISVGHRPTIVKYHPQVLELTGDGG